MNNKQILLSFFIIASILIGKNAIMPTYAMEENIKIGHCPTMNSLLNSFNSTSFDTSASVFQALNNELIDISVTGRPPLSNELNSDYNTILIAGDYTLISNNKILIPESSLNSLKVHTYFNINESVFGEIIIHNSLNEALSQGNNEIVLIKWADYKDEGLVIPVNNNGNKFKEFRGVFLTGKDINQLLKLKEELIKNPEIDSF